MKLDLLIKNGRVLDPETGNDQIADIGVLNGRIAGAHHATESVQVLDAAGCYVTPGLIDFHVHLFHGGSAMGISPDILLSFGITSAVDPGSSGCANYELFYANVVLKSDVRIKSFLHVCPSGLPGYGLCEYPDPAMMPRGDIRRLVERYRGEILGLKIRIGAECVGNLGLEPLKTTISIGEEVGLPVCVHVTNAAFSAEEILSLLRPGDIFCHMYHAKGQSSIIGANGKVLPLVKKARERGVLFDAANGRNHFSTEIASSAIADSFTPDIISTDAIRGTLCASPAVKNLPYVMSKYLNMGLSLMDVLRAVTQTPAKLMNLGGQIGTLREGAYADICILREINGEVCFMDAYDQSFIGNKILSPQVTIRDGKISWCQTDFPIFV